MNLQVNASPYLGLKLQDHKSIWYKFCEMESPPSIANVYSRIKT